MLGTNHDNFILAHEVLVVLVMVIVEGRGKGAWVLGRVICYHFAAGRDSVMQITCHAWTGV